MMTALELMSLILNSRKDAVSEICTACVLSFEENRELSEKLLEDALKKGLISSTQADEEKLRLKSAEDTVATAIKTVIQNESSIIAYLPDLASAEIAAEATRRRFEKRIAHFESEKSGDAEVQKLRVLKKEIRNWLEAALIGADAESIAIAAAKTDLDNNGYVHYLDNKSEKGGLGFLDRLLASWIGYGKITEARLQWSEFEEGLTGKIAERQARIGEIDDAISKRFKAHRIAANRYMSGELNEALKASALYEDMDAVRQHKLGTLYRMQAEFSIMLDKIAARMTEGQSGSKHGVSDVLTKVKALAVGENVTEKLPALWMKLERISTLAALVKGHLAYEHRYDLDPEAWVRDKLNASATQASELFSNLEDCVVTV